MKPDLHSFPPTAMTAKPRLIVCERKAVWATRLRSQLPREIAIRQLRVLGDVSAELELSPASLLVVEVTAENFAPVLELLADLGRAFPLARAVAVGERNAAALREAMREAGAVDFVTSPRSADQIAGIVRRHLERAPRPRLTLAARIWESLPWQDAAG
jgi:DNA-binding NtrC family response regulator